MFNRYIIAIILSCCIHKAGSQSIPWQEFNQHAFDLASQQHKPVLLDLGASWCHWCHVMDDSTYENPAVISYLSQNYICIKANQDKRPDLYAKYKDYGWPATIIFHEDGRELLKQAGYFSPAEFLLLLQKTYNGYRYIAPQKKVVVNTLAPGKWSTATAAFVRKNFVEYLDMVDGGYDMQQHFLEYDGIEYALRHSKTDPALKKWLPLTIHGSYLINDPVWGGVYQYSTNGDWEHPHFEKILSILAQIALENKLPEEISPAQVRCALTAVNKRMFEVPGTFDQQGWLQIGFCGHQPEIADIYTSTGSLYLCTTGFLALGLPVDHPFWAGAAQPWTAKKAWAGAMVKKDHSIDY